MSCSVGCRHGSDPELLWLWRGPAAAAPIQPLGWKLLYPKVAALKRKKKRKDTCTPMFIAALFTTAETWKQPKCPPTEKWIKKIWYINTMEYYSTTQRTK